MAIVSRLQLDHPTLGTAGGSALHASIEAIYKKIGDNMADRFFYVKDLNAAASADCNHDFNTDFGDLRIDVYAWNEGTGELTLLTDATTPARSEIAVIAKVGDTKKQITVTNNSASQVDLGVVILNDPIELAELTNVDMTGVADEDGVIYNASTKKYVKGMPTAKALGIKAAQTTAVAAGTPEAGYNKIYPKSDRKWYALDEDGVETQLGSGSGGSETTYIGNNDFESTGDSVQPATWAKYADVAGATPVDGVGGSPNAAFTFVASTTSPLRGTRSAILTKDANNRQGHGISYDFAISPVDCNKMLKVQFDMSPGGSYAAGDIGVFLYDVTNSTLITPTVSAVPNQVGVFQACFISTSSTSYRLILHVASTNASAWTMKLDTIIVGPGQLIQGLAAQGWRSPTTNVVLKYGASPAGNITSYTTFYRRVGDSMSLRTRIVFSGPADANGIFTVALPDSLTIDTTKIQSGGTALESSCLMFTNSKVYTGVVTLSSTGISVYRAAADGVASGANWAGNTTGASNVPGGAAIANGDELELYASNIPVSQWSSSVYLGNEIVEYASNDSRNTSSDSDDDTSFVTGPAGSATPGPLTVQRSKRVRFQNPIQPTDTFVIEHRTTVNNAWLPIAGADDQTGIHALIYQNPGSPNVNKAYGVGVRAINSTDIYVTFGQYSSTYGAQGYGGTGAAWATNLGFWRVKKISAGALSGFNMAQSASAGLAPAGVFDGSNIDLQPLGSTPANPTSSSDAKVYLKGSKLVVMYNDGGTVRWKYLDLAGTGTTWTHTTSAP